jgi:hypothetical protein
MKYGWHTGFTPCDCKQDSQKWAGRDVVNVSHLSKKLTLAERNGMLIHFFVESNFIFNKRELSQKGKHS